LSQFYYILAKKYNKIIVNENKIGILILCLFCQFSFGQIESRKIFKGQVRNDLAPVENVIVLMQIQKWAIVNEYGFFMF
jgi:hypothetical protein